VEGEERFSTVGPTNSGRWLLVVTTMRGPKVRVVTAFNATRRLIEFYLEEKERI
jgi:uncharacterized DUF497 family protein